jgi:hypothetical protein
LVKPYVAVVALWAAKQGAGLAFAHATTAGTFSMAGLDWALLGPLREALREARDPALLLPVGEAAAAAAGVAVVLYLVQKLKGPPEDCIDLENTEDREPPTHLLEM